MARPIDYIALIRPAHWIKNLFVFAGPLFGRRLAQPLPEALMAVWQALWAFIAFCAASSAAYVFNDIADAAYDRIHPLKSARPVAAGRIGVARAGAIAAILAIAATAMAWSSSMNLAAIILGYMGLMAAYTVALRKVMIIDCMVIALGFCLRAVAGAVAVDVAISPWLLICTFALCLFVAFGKRRAEIVQLGQDGQAFRQVLAGYSTGLLDHMLDVSSGLAVICFLIYAMDQRTSTLFGTHAFVYTGPMVLYCVFRFSWAMRSGRYDGPVGFILKDLPFQLGLICWLVACGIIVYGGRSLGAWLR